MLWRVFSIIWIAVMLVINLFALTALLDAWEIADTAWKPEFYDLGIIYGAFTRTVASYVEDPIKSTLGIELPCWWVHLFVIYAATASSIWIGSMTHEEGKERVSEIKRGGFSVAWALAALGMLYQGVQNRYVTNYLRQHTGMGIVYLLSVLGLYGLANWTNSEYLDSAVVPGQEVALRNADRCALDPRIKEKLLDRGKEAVKEQVLGGEI